MAHFSTIPKELRDEIYTHYLRGLNWEWVELHLLPAVLSDYPLVNASRVIREEIFELLMRTRSFTYTLSGGDTPFSVLGQSVRGRIRRLKLDVTLLNDLDYRNGFDFVEQRLDRLLHNDNGHSALKHLEVCSAIGRLQDEVRASRASKVKDQPLAQPLFVFISTLRELQKFSVSYDDERRAWFGRYSHTPDAEAVRKHIEAGLMPLVMRPAEGGTSFGSNSNAGGKSLQFTRDCRNETSGPLSSHPRWAVSSAISPSPDLTMLFASENQERRGHQRLRKGQSERLWWTIGRWKNANEWNMRKFNRRNGFR